VEVISESKLNGRTIRELGIRNQTGASIVGVIRQGVFTPNPPADYRFASGDLVAVIGKLQEITTFQELYHPGRNKIKGTASIDRKTLK
jgi:K+/H+ antiporter YhaU regulatory subunit KhtT